MKVYDSFPFHLAKRDRAIALGFFDGVHLGHQKLIQELLEVSRKCDLCPAVFTFDSHPASLLDSNFKFSGLIQTVDLRLEKLADLEVAETVLAPMIEAVSHISAKDFYRHYLCEQFSMRAMVVGDDAHFGYKGQGDADLLTLWTKRDGLDFIRVSDVMVDGEKVSSTRIRLLLEKGRVREANRCLGYPFQVKGRVVTGKKLGRTLGFPTINLAYDDRLVQLLYGVYASRVLVGGQAYPAISSIGTNPTVDESQTVKLETYIYDKSMDLYDEIVRVEFLDFIRPEIHFPSVEAMTERILSDLKFVEDCHKRGQYR